MIIFLFPVGLILMWMQTNWKKSVKWVVTIVVLLIAFTAGTGDEDSDTIANDSSENTSVESADDSTEEAELEGPTDEEIAEQEEKERLEKEQAEKEAEEKRLAKEQEAKEEKEKAEKEQAEKEKAEAEAEKKSEKFQHEVIEGVDTYTLVSGTNWSANSMMTGFSVDATSLLQDVHQDLTNGAVFRIATTLTDTYGNESQEIVSTVWYSQETVEKINYDNWPRLVGEDLYNTADGVIVHYAIGNDVEVENKSAGNNAPNFYRDSIGVEFE